MKLPVMHFFSHKVKRNRNQLFHRVRYFPQYIDDDKYSKENKNKPNDPVDPYFYIRIGIDLDFVGKNTFENVNGKHCTQCTGKKQKNSKFISSIR